MVVGHHADSASGPTKAEARTVAAVLRGDPKAINSLILNDDKRRTVAYFRAGMADAVLSHFKFPEAVAARPETTSPKVTQPELIISILINFTSPANSPWLAPIRAQIASKLKPLLRILCEETTIWGQTEHHTKMACQVVLLIHNLLLSPEVVKPVLRQVTAEDSSNPFTSFLGRALVGRWDSPLLDADLIRKLRRSCLQVFVELVDVLPSGEDDVLMISAGCANLKSILQVEVEAWNGRGAASTLGSEFLTMLASSQINAEVAESAFYVFHAFSLGCPDVADGDGMGGFGPANGVEKVVRMLNAHVFSESNGASKKEVDLWSLHGFKFLLLCLHGARRIPDDSRTAIFISSGALTLFVKLGIKFGRQDAEVTKNTEHSLGMVGAVARLKKTSKAAAAKKRELVAALQALSGVAKGQPHMMGTSIAAAALAKQFGGLSENNDGSAEQRQEFTYAKAGCSRCFKITKDFQCCSICRTRYCSSECQMDDWKNGGHKALCEQKKGLTRAKDFGREGKDLSAIGDAIIEERHEAAALIAAIEGVSLIDCVIVVKLGGCAAQVQPLLQDEYLRWYNKDCMAGASASPEEEEEEERDRQYTLSVLARNKQNGKTTVAVHSDQLRCLKTMADPIPHSDVVGKAQMIHLMSRAASLASGQPVADKIKAVVAALRSQGMLSGEQIMVVLGGPMDHPVL